MNDDPLEPPRQKIVGFVHDDVVALINSQAARAIEEKWARFVLKPSNASTRGENR